MSRKQQEQPWSYKGGRRGSSVIVYERRGVGGVVYAKTWSQPDGRHLKESFGRQDENQPRNQPRRHGGVGDLPAFVV